MILAFAGRRAQSIDGDLDAVTLRVRRLLTALRPSAVIGAAADGGDLVVLEAALATDGVDVHVILPTPREVFAEQSVVPEWRDRFQRVLAEVERRGTVETLGLEDGREAYRRANVAFLDRAAELAGEGERVVVLVVTGEGEGEMVQDLVATGRLRDAPALRIDPDVTITDRPRAFVAMPYGRKLDPQRRFELDCDLVYQKLLLPALENAQLYYRRADEEIDSGVVLQPMIEWLAEAELVIGDLQTANFNVGWELGLRHLMRSRQTVLLRPRGTLAPFDLSMLRHVVYHHDEQGISDDAAIEAWEQLASHLRAAGEAEGHTDSPLDAVMEVEQRAVVKRPTARQAQVDQIRERLALARDLADADLMLEVLEDARELNAGSRLLLHAEAGVGLVRLGQYDAAREFLEPVVADDRDVLRPEAHIYYAQTLYRPTGAGLDEYNAAERVLRRVLLRRPGQPEIRAMLGAVAKRRLRLRERPEDREPDIRLALESYRHDYEHDLNAFYEGINVVAMATTLHIGFGDEPARALARGIVPAVRVAARLALRDRPNDFWAAATLAECALHETVLGFDAPPIRAAYAEAAALKPPRGDLDSTRFQLEFLGSLGFPAQPLAEAHAGLVGGA